MAHAQKSFQNQQLIKIKPFFALENLIFKQRELSCKNDTSCLVASVFLEQATNVQVIAINQKAIVHA